MSLEAISFICETTTGIVRPKMQSPVVPSFPNIFVNAEDPSSRGTIEQKIQTIESRLTSPEAAYLRAKQSTTWNVLHAQLATLRLQQWKTHSLDTFPDEKFYELNGDPVWMLYELPFWQVFKEVDSAMRMYQETGYESNESYETIISHLQSLVESHTAIKLYQEFESEGRLGIFLRNTALTAHDNPELVFGSLAYSSIMDTVLHAQRTRGQLSSQYDHFICPENSQAIDPVKGIFTLVSELGTSQTQRQGKKLFDSNDHLLPGGKFLRWASDEKILPYETDTVQLFIDRTFPNSMLFWSEICSESGGNMYTMAYQILYLIQSVEA